VDAKENLVKSYQKDTRLTLLVVFSVLLIVGLMVTATEKNSVVINGYSAIFYCAFIAIGVQWFAWVPASIKKTESFYDITGGLTYIAIICFSLWAGNQIEPPSTREWIISLLVGIWSLRLSSFLFLRIHRTGRDGRFDDLKTSPTRFLVPWTLQGLWVFLTMNVVIVINSQSSTAPAIGTWDIVGLIIWIFGFSIEVIADYQKTVFNSDISNQDKWIDRGLWSICRHPNYLGEIILWCGIACFGISCFTGLERLAWISPIFVYFLLTRISGIPILDRRAFSKWGEDSEYLNYREKTPLLFPSFRT
tara:strand:+ start:183 stop:1097 length:915 start_codon:yes stop_codon:yes gene_type:complete